MGRLSRLGLAALVPAALGAVLVFAVLRREPAPVPRAPAPIPVDIDVTAPPDPPVVDGPEAFVRARIEALRAAADVAERGAVVRASIDPAGWAASVLGAGWRELSADERADAARDFADLAASLGARAAPDWLRAEPRVVGVGAAGDAVRVRTRTADAIEVVFVLTPVPGLGRYVVTDVVMEGVSMVAANRHASERRGAAQTLARVKRRIAILRDEK